MILYPNAKINLGLNILEKRNDGYHNIETVMIPIPVFDVLELTESNDFEMIYSGIPLPMDGKPGLCEMAYQSFCRKHPIPPVRIHLRKQIPIGAGLGGGSSDAAFTLLGLNEMFEVGLSKQDLMDMAAEIGSDCAFFIQNQPCLATGRGEILHPISLDLDNLYIVLIHPDLHISTKEAYAKVVPEVPKYALGKRIHFPQQDWQACLPNDFEPGLALQYPEIADGISRLKEAGAFYAALSGSGSSYFGLFTGDALKNRAEWPQSLFVGKLELTPKKKA
jgi:4-diphosphocytidyl-2-C-methyl-D-erythritol kinase